jgi:hypothetical protein
MSKKIENFEIEINNIKNKLNEEEIKNSKLAFDNNILSNKIESINKEKEEQIKVIESLYQKQIDNCNKSISQLNDKLLQSLKENKISSDEESINKRYLNNQYFPNQNCIKIIMLNVLYDYFLLSSLLNLYCLNYKKTYLLLHIIIMMLYFYCIHILTMIFYLIY